MILKAWIGLTVVMLAWGDLAHALEPTRHQKCGISGEEIILKDTLRQANEAGYASLVNKHKIQVATCRGADVIKVQALWLKPGELSVGRLDRLVNQGYNALFIEGGAVEPNLWGLADQRGLAVYGIFNLSGETIAPLRSQNFRGMLFQIKPEAAQNLSNTKLLNELPKELRPLMSLYLEQGKLTGAAIAQITPAGLNRSKSLEQTAKLTEKMLRRLMVRRFEQEVINLINQAIATSSLDIGTIYPVGLEFIPVQFSGAIYPILAAGDKPEKLARIIQNNPSRVICPVLITRVVVAGVSCVVYQEL